MLKMQQLKASSLGAIMFCMVALLASCGSENDPAPTTNPPDNTGGGQSVSVTDTDRTLFKQVKQAGDIYDQNTIWNGFDFSKRGMYYVWRDASGEAARGYVINAHQEISGATKIEGDQAEGLSVYRYDAPLAAAQSSLKSGNDAFEFTFNINGGKYYLQAYTDASVMDNANGAILLATHEMFHVFQESWVSFGIQDEHNYPINKDLLALQMLTARIAEKFPAETDKAVIRKYLQMYVAIREQEMSLDPSADKLVENMANAQENFEGTARYVEYEMAKQVLSGFNRPFSQEDFSSISTADEVRQTFAFGIWYGTGSAVTYMIDNLTDNIETECIKGVSLYDQASSLLNMSTSEKATALEAAKGEFNWTNITAEAERLAKL